MNKPSHKLMQNSVDVILWAIAQQTPITPQRIRDRWHVNRATAYRWRGPLEDARVRASFMTIPKAHRFRTPVVDDMQQVSTQ